MPTLMPITNITTVAEILRESETICLTWLWQQIKQAVYNVHEDEEKDRKLVGLFSPNLELWEKTVWQVDHLSLHSATLTFLGKVNFLKKLSHIPHPLIVMAYYKHKCFTNCRVTSSLCSQCYSNLENTQQQQKE